MRLLILSVGLAALLSACSNAQVQQAPPEPKIIRVVETQTVEVPVYVHPSPPAELMEPFRPDDLPFFVGPDDPAATSALTPENEVKLRLLLYDLQARDRAWRAWAAEESAKEGAP